MSEEKFTKGPWLTEYKKDISGMYAQKVFDENREDICSCSWYPVYEGNGITTTNREANAHLIAAAPEMYECLQMWVTMVEHGNTDHFEINEHNAEVTRKLLAKSRGQHEP